MTTPEHEARADKIGTAILVNGKRKETMALIAQLIADSEELKQSKLDSDKWEELYGLSGQTVERLTRELATCKEKAVEHDNAANQLTELFGGLDNDSVSCTVNCLIREYQKAKENANALDSLNYFLLQNSGHISILFESRKVQICKVGGEQVGVGESLLTAITQAMKETKV